MEGTRKIIIISQRRTELTEPIRKKYSCYPDKYITELSKDSKWGEHTGRKPDVVKNKILTLMRNLHIDERDYVFIVRSE